MDNRPIGFFDSGLGGLTCIPSLMEKLPKERIIYYGDTARTPYGSKAIATIKTFSFEIADFLMKNDVKMIVIACNTVSSTALYDLREKYPDIPILGIISPASYTISKTCDASNQIGIIGTKVTIKSGAYRNKILSLNSELNIHEIACPVFVPLIEEGIMDNDIMDLSIKYYLDHFISFNKIDTLVLGCTHYPLIKANINKLYPDVKIVNPSEEIFQSIDDTLSRNDIYAVEPEVNHAFYASDLSENFTHMSSNIFKNTDCQAVLKPKLLDEVRL